MTSNTPLSPTFPWHHLGAASYLLSRDATLGATNLSVKSATRYYQWIQPP